jgi:hypothetical protein
VILIEACEESAASTCRVHRAPRPRIGTPSLVVCLDSGCANYEQLWCTTSLRGLVIGTLEVSLLTEGVHSGDGSGVVASSFRVLRECSTASRTAPPARSPARARPRSRAARDAGRRAAEVLGDEVWTKFPFQPGAEPVTRDATELVLNRTWRPALAVTGADGLPPDRRCRQRDAAAHRVQAVAAGAAHPRRRARDRAGSSRSSRPTRRTAPRSPTRRAAPTAAGTHRLWAPWLETALETASQAHFGKPPVFMGEGGSIRVHGHARPEVPRGAVLHHRRARPGLERPRPQRIPPPAHRPQLTLVVADVLAAHAQR